MKGRDYFSISMFFLHFFKKNLIRFFIGVGIFLIPFSVSAQVSAPQVLVSEVQKKAISVFWFGDVRGVIDDMQSLYDSEYIITLTDKKTGKELVSEKTTDLAWTFSDLEVNHGYVVSVSTVRGGESSAATNVTVRTLPGKVKKLQMTTVRRKVFRDVITNTPLNQFGDASSSPFLAKLTWKKPSGKIRYYTVKIYNKKGKLIKTKKTKKRTVGISGLVVGRIYSYRVIAHFNDEYSSDLSGRQKFKMKKR